MSEADKLFDELGYSKQEGNFSLCYRRDGNFGVEEIYFDKIYNSFSKAFNYEYSYITMQELKAINMKCKELGWSDE